MGILLAIIAVTNTAALLAKLFTLPIVRGIQLGLGLLLAREGLRLVLGRQSILALPNGASVTGWEIALGAAILLLSFHKSTRYPAALILLTVGITLGLLTQWGKMPQFAWGPLPLQFLHPHADEFWRVLPLLVIPQFALTFGNSIVATENTSQILYGPQGTARHRARAQHEHRTGQPCERGGSGRAHVPRFRRHNRPLQVRRTNTKIELHHRWAVYTARLVRKSGHWSPASHPNRHSGSVSDLRWHPARSLSTRYCEASAATAYRNLRWGSFASDHQFDVGILDGICPARNLTDL